MEKKLFLAALFGLFFVPMACAQVSLQERYSSNTGFYTRVYFEKNLFKKFGLTTGYNVDGRCIAHLEASYEAFDGVKLVAGTGYHHFQDGFHPSVGILIHKDIFDVELDGHIRMLFNHLYHIGSEFELVRKFDNTWQAGIATEVEIGKEFMPLKEAEETYTRNHPEYETVILVGPTIGYRCNERFSVNCFVICGLQNQHAINNFSYKTSIGLTYTFLEKDH